MKGSWVSMKNALQVNTAFLDKGILVMRTEDAEPLPLTTDTSIQLGSRQLCFYQNGRETISRQNVTKQESLLRALGYTRIYSDYIYNSERREEIFLPIQLKSQSPDRTTDIHYTRYVYPWLSTSSNYPTKLEGFEEFVTGGCLFGGSLEAKDAKGLRIQLIKHDLHFYPTQQFNYILYDINSASPYDAQLLHEIEKLAIFIDQHAAANKPKHLTYHLPYIDYILFGVKLFIHGRIRLSALDKFIKIIFEKREVLIKKITEIGDRHGIVVCFTSPFENLFQLPTPERIKRELLRQLSGEWTRYFLKIMKIPKVDIDPEAIDEQACKEKEKAFVHYCLTQLKTNHYNDKHQQIWHNILTQTHCSKDPSKERLLVDSVHNMEDLFKLANSVMLAIASSGKPDYKTCSWLPLTEKQIQIGYASYSKNAGLNWPVIFNATVVDPVVNYNYTNNGLLFYNDQQLEIQANLLKKWHATHEDGALLLLDKRPDTPDSSVDSDEPDEVNRSVRVAW